MFGVAVGEIAMNGTVEFCYGDFIKTIELGGINSTHEGNIRCWCIIPKGNDHFGYLGTNESIM
jgi:hypothetical protein